MNLRHGPSRKLPLTHALTFACVLIFSLTPVLAQSSPASTSALAQTQQLQNRMQEATGAEQSGDLEQASTANKRVIAFALAQMADLRGMQGALPESIELYKLSLKYEETPQTHLWAALAYMRANMTDEALKEATRVLELDPKNAGAWNLQGKLLLMKKDYAKAVESLEKSLTLQSDMEVAYTLSTALLNLHEKDKALSVISEIERVGGDSAALHVMAGRNFESAGFTEDAEREYKRAAEIDPKSSRAHYFLGLMHLTKNGWEVTPQIRAEFQEEVAANPTDFFGNYFLGYIASTEKNFDESDKYMKVAAASKPDWPEPYLYMGLNAYGRGDNKAAETLLRKTIELTGKDEPRNNYQVRRAYFTLGRILIQNGQKEEGTRLVQRSKEIETKLVVNTRQQALASNDAAAGVNGPATTASSAAPATLKPVKDPTAALDPAVLKASTLSDSEKSKTLDAERGLRTVLSNALNDLGTTEARKRNFTQALRYFQDAEKWDAETAGLQRNVGLAAFFSRDYSESARALKTVAAKNPQDQIAQSMLAMSLYMTKDYAGAVKVFDEIGDAAINDPRMAYGWAFSLSRVNDREHASAVLQKLVAQPIPTEMLISAGQLYAELGDKANAQKCFDRAKQQGDEMTTH